MKMNLNLSHVTRFLEKCESLGVPVPPALAAVKSVIAIADSLEEAPAVSGALEMSAEQIQEFVVDQAMRRHSSPGDGQGLKPGITAFTALAMKEFSAAVIPQLDDVVIALQPRFEEAAAPLVDAVSEFGFTLNTTADQIISMEDDEATAAWRNARRSWDAIYPLVMLRIQMVEVFNLRPAKDEQPTIRSMHREPNMTVLFAAGDNWSLGDEYRVEKSNSIDWFDLARGGLRLNTPSEVDAKLQAREAQWRRERSEAAAADAARAGEEAQAFLAQAERGMRATR